LPHWGLCFTLIYAHFKLLLHTMSGFLFLLSWDVMHFCSKTKEWADATIVGALSRGGDYIKVNVHESWAGLLNY